MVTSWYFLCRILYRFGYRARINLSQDTAYLLKALFSNAFQDCGFDWGDCCLCTVTEDPNNGFEFYSSSSYVQMFNCLDPDAADLEELYDCEVSPASALPCPADSNVSLVVEDRDDVNVLAETVYCTGGTFDVEWRGHIVVDQHIVVPNGTVLNITGVGSNATIDGGGVSRLFTVLNASLVATDITMRNGSSLSGGAVYASGSTLLFHQTTFVDNVAYRIGGALLVSQASNASFHDTIFETNSASVAGGALYLANDSRAYWTGSTGINGNAAVTNGGAVRVSDGGKAFWAGVTTFSGNSANGDGGAIYVSDGGNATWKGVTTFTRNSAYAGSGGAVNVRDRGRCFFTAEMRFRSNIAKFYGGALHASNGDVSWGANVLFFNNTAIIGGAILLTDGSNIEYSGETNFTSNTAYLDGGAVGSTPFDQSTEESYLVFKGPTYFVGNMGRSNGGGMALLGSLSIQFASTDVVFSGNAAGVAGGAVFLSATGIGPTFNGTIFDSNSAQVGGGVFATGSGTTVSTDDWENVVDFPTRFIGCTFLDNTANSTGGAVNSASGKDEFFRTSFVRNSALVGGALLLAVKASLSNCSFIDNISDADDGPALSNIGTITSLQDSFFSGNKFRCEAQHYFNFNEVGSLDIGSFIQDRPNLARGMSVLRCKSRRVPYPFLPHHSFPPPLFYLQLLESHICG